MEILNQSCAAFWQPVFPPRLAETRGDAARVPIALALHPSKWLCSLREPKERTAAPYSTAPLYAIPTGVQWGPGIKHSAGEPLLRDSVQRGHPDDMHREQRCSQARHGPGNPTVALNGSIPFPCSGLVRTSNYFSAGVALPAESSS